MSLCCILDYKWVTVMDGVQFEFNGIISLYKKNDSERKPMTLQGIFYDIIVN